MVLGCPRFPIVVDPIGRVYVDIAKLQPYESGWLGIGGIYINSSIVDEKTQHLHVQLGRPTPIHQQSTQIIF